VVLNKDEWTIAQMLTNDRFTTQKLHWKMGHKATFRPNKIIHRWITLIKGLVILPMQGVYFQALLS